MARRAWRVALPPKLSSYHANGERKLAAGRRSSGAWFDSHAPRGLNGVADTLERLERYGARSPAPITGQASASPRRRFIFTGPLFSLMMVAIFPPSRFLWRCQPALHSRALDAVAGARATIFAAKAAMSRFHYAATTPPIYSATSFHLPARLPLSCLADAALFDFFLYLRLAPRRLSVSMASSCSARRAPASTSFSRRYGALYFVDASLDDADYDAIFLGGPAAYFAATIFADTVYFIRRSDFERLTSR